MTVLRLTCLNECKGTVLGSRTFPFFLILAHLFLFFSDLEFRDESIG